MYSKNTNVSGLWRKTVATVTYLRRKITSITGFWKGPFSRTEMPFLRTDVCACISSKRSKIGKFSFNEWKTWLCSFVSVILRPKRKQRSENPWNSHLHFNEASMAIDHRGQIPKLVDLYIWDTQAYHATFFFSCKLSSVCSVEKIKVLSNGWTSWSNSSKLDRPERAHKQKHKHLRCAM